MLPFVVPAWVSGGIWPWIKKYGVWIVLILAVAGVYFLGRSHGSVTVVNTGQELQEADKRRDEIEAELRTRIAELERQRDEQVTEVLEEHEDTVDELNDEQEERVDELLEDPGALNNYLLEVGRRVGSSNN